MIGRVRAALKRDPDLKSVALSKLTGLTQRQCTKALARIRNPQADYARTKAWKARNPERCAAMRTRWRREHGVRPKAEALAELRAKSKSLARPVLKAKAKGGSFTEVGKTLGLTRNAVAGRLWRAKQRELVEGAVA